MAPVPWPGVNNDFFELLGKITLIRRGKEIEKKRKLNRMEKFQVEKGKHSNKVQIFWSFFQSLEHLFLTLGQNNFGNKIPFPIS